VRGAVTALCLIQFVDVMGVTVVITALPPMLADVGAAPAHGTLMATGYAMFFGGLLMLGARLGDRYGHRRTILASLGLFAVGALLAATATSAITLTAGRCVQGAAAAGAVPSALRLLTSVVTGGRARARAVASWSAAGAAAGASGFVVGGLVTEFTSWRFIFWGLLAVSAVQVVAVVALVPGEERSEARHPLNLAGSALLTAAVMLLVGGAAALGEPGHRVSGGMLLAVGAAVAGLFAVADRRSAAPVLPRDLLAAPQVSRGTAGAFVNTATISVATLITLYLQGTLGRSSVAAAATLLPSSILVIGGSALAARLLVSQRSERVTAAGLGLIAVGISAPLLRPSSAVLVGAGMAIAGLGLGLSSVATTAMATDVPEEPRATASGLVNTSAQLGAAIGTAALLLIAATTTGTAGRTAGTPYIAWAAAAVLAAIAAAVFTRLRTSEKH
jgi:MFS family permease